MPITRHLKDVVFAPEHIEAMGIAFINACKSLNLVDKSDPITDIIAGKIIELAHQGEHNAERLCANVLAIFTPKE